MILLQRQIPDATNAAELLEYATIMLFWNTAKADGGLDPCEALMRSASIATVRAPPEQRATDLAMAVFGLAGYGASHLRPGFTSARNPTTAFHLPARSGRRRPRLMTRVKSDEVEGRHPEPAEPGFQQSRPMLKPLNACGA